MIFCLRLANHTFKMSGFPFSSTAFPIGMSLPRQDEEQRYRRQSFQADSKASQSSQETTSVKRSRNISSEIVIGAGVAKKMKPLPPPYPPTTNQIRDRALYKNLWVGTWNWAHDGCTCNGFLILEEEGILETNLGCKHATHNTFGIWKVVDHLGLQIEVDWPTKRGRVRHTLQFVSSNHQKNSFVVVYRSFYTAESDIWESRSAYISTQGWRLTKAS